MPEGRHCPVSNSRCKEGKCEWWTTARLGPTNKPIPMCAITLLGLCMHAELKLMTAAEQEGEET